MKLGCHDGAAGQLVALSFEHLRNSRTEGAHRATDYTNDSRVPDTTNNDKLSKVLVERDENAPLRVRALQHFNVARIAFPVACPDHIVTGCDERVDATAPNA